MKESGPDIIGPRGGGLRVPRIALPGRYKAVLGLCFVTALFIMWCYFSFLVYVRPNEFGIKQVQIGLKSGIQERVYEPGLWFVMPFGFERMHTLPRNIQVFELSLEPGYDTPSMAFDGVAKIPTSDGFFVDVDVTVFYHIVDPYKVITQLGPGKNYLDRGIRPVTDPILKQSMGQLKVEDFYNSPLRVKQVALAKELLNQELNSKGIQVEQVLVRYFKYTEAIQQNIEDKKLQDQLVFTNQSKGRAAQIKQELEKVRSQGEYDVKIALQTGDAFKVKREAEKDLYVRSKKAEADLLTKLAEAKRVELRNAALQTEGSDAQVALRMAEVLGGLDTILLPAGGKDGANPLALDELIRKFGMGAGAFSTSAAKPAPPPPPPPPPPAATPPAPAAEPATRTQP